MKVTHDKKKYNNVHEILRANERETRKHRIRNKICVGLEEIKTQN